MTFWHMFTRMKSKLKERSTWAMKVGRELMYLGWYTCTKHCVRFFIEIILSNSLSKLWELVMDGQGSLTCCSPRSCRVRRNWATKLNWILGTVLSGARWYSHFMCEETEFLKMVQLISGSRWLPCLLSVFQHSAYLVWRIT